MSLFQRLGSAAPEQEIYELFQQPPQKDTDIASAPLPAPSESIGDPPSPPDKYPRVITVEVG